MRLIKQCSPSLAVKHLSTINGMF